MTTICKNCLVELGEEMKLCPLCGTPVSEDGQVKPTADLTRAKASNLKADEKHLMQRILWQITVTLLFSGIVATLIIDIAIHKDITWSLYPMSVCLIVLSYASLLAFWRTKMIYQILAGWFLSSLLLVVINQLSAAAGWATGLGIPLLFAVNFISLTLLGVFLVTKRKGLNLLAYTFVAMAVLCISIEGIISHHFTGEVNLGWSIIVTACLLPVTAALIFMFYRTRNNPKLQKIFHT